MQNSRTIEINGVGRVLFERSRRAKRVSITVRPFTGVRVAVPAGSSFAGAEEFVRSRMDWLRRSLQRMKHYEKKDRVVSGVMSAADREKAGRKLTGRLEYLAKKHGFTWNRAFIRNQRTRWGSCSHKNNISLNVKLVNLPEELMDYVIMHELVHTRIKNHGAGFWAELDKYVGSGKTMAAKLREYRLGG